MLLQGDANCEMERIPDGSVDMILTDPPYGTTQNHWDVVIDWSKWWQQASRVTKANAAIVIFSSGMHTADLMKSNPKQWRYNVVWFKNAVTGHLNARKMPMRAHEDICVFYRSLPTYHPQKSKGHAPQKNNHNGAGGSGYRPELEQVPTSQTFGSTERYPHSVLQFAVVPPAKKEHHSQKPQELLQHLIQTYTKTGAVVLDTFAGSGSTAQACLNTRRSYILIEKDKDIFAKLKKKYK